MLEWDYRRLTLETLLRYASNVNKKCGYSNIWGFIDGTFRPTTRPTENQRLVYSGYKRAHGFKYQAVVTPDGLIYISVWARGREDWRLEHAKRVWT
ncbi:hypothetical protein LIPSTDRAFT_67431 [Lipomyces starkeyi NRRL Y-11557]|uniref:DDE Tnp4 domain-containing protein n=1 Tax=Lipomyces starkeyi NRRL Y-11557 TaxID=675824 RepID=A0A1E3QFN1_LIPST|nr:hypothetical protein LIPSTDRAFT_67431 [Lipomyces starkeyi NRRL Y-11557]